MIVNRTIILVEDSDSDRLLFSKYLKQIGYDCLCMDSADRLISQIDGVEPSIILMDIEMPGITGLEAALILRKREEQSGKKHIIIALTAHNDENIMGIVATAGFDDYLQKPITKRELKTKLSRYILNESDTMASSSDVKQENGTSKGKLYSLDMFEADEPDFVRSIVEMFVENTPGSIAAIKKAFELDEMETVRQQAHKLKPHFSFFGAAGLQQTFQMIEDYARANDNKEQLPDLINSAEKKILLMVEQMRTDLLS
ncbi:MAG: response regulator [Bacteroidales bacterium]|nr:response regulator [Bacteroidales bacterium]